MAALVRKTEILDDAAAMAADLTRDLPASGAGLAVLFCLPETPYEELYARLCRAAPLLTIIGGTTLYMPFAYEREDWGAVLTVFPPGRFATVLSPPFKPDQADEQMSALKRDCLAKLGEPPNMFLCFLPPPPELVSVVFTPPLLAALGSTPCLGGLVSDWPGSNRGAVLAEGRAHRNRLVLAALAGGTRPVFSHGQDMTFFSEFSPAVTEVDRHRVRRVNEMTFFDYLRWLDFNPEDPAFMSGCPISGLVRRGSESEIKALVGLDFDSESGLFAGPVPPGATISLGFLTPENVRASIRPCCDTLMAKMAAGRAAGREYSLIFYVTCLGRRFAQAGHNAPEADYLRSSLNLPLSGFCGDGEIGPAQTLTSLNSLNAFSIIMAAL